MSRRAPVWLTAALVFFAPSWLRAAPGETEDPRFKKVFHIAGVPGAVGDARVDLTFAAARLVIEMNGTKFISVPYSRIRRVHVLSGERRYPNATYAAALATAPVGGVGSLLILKTRKVDTLVVEYLTERGGAMGMVFQLSMPEGERCVRVLETLGIPVEQPPPEPLPAPEQK